MFCSISAASGQERINKRLSSEHRGSHRSQVMLGPRQSNASSSILHGVLLVQAKEIMAQVLQEANEDVVPQEEDVLSILWGL